MRHVIVTRFSVPRADAATADRHRERSWLVRRLALFRRYFVPSVERLNVPVVLLCSSQSAGFVTDNTGDLSWIDVVVQDRWHGGWTGGPDQMVTRLDSDDAIHEGWLEALEAAPAGFEVYCTRRFLRLDADRGGLYARSRRHPSPLAAFRSGRNPYARDHAKLHRHYRTFHLREPYLLQIIHGGNVSSRRPRWWHAGFRVSLDRLTPFGVRPGGRVSDPDAS